MAHNLCSLFVGFMHTRQALVADRLTRSEPSKLVFRSHELQLAPAAAVFELIVEFLLGKQHALIAFVLLGRENVPNLVVRLRVRCLVG